MTNEPSPRPWQVRYGDTVADATGAKVAACLRPENAALIVDAVNFYDATVDTQLTALLDERDRLRDIVRETLGAIDALYTVAAPNAIVKELAPDRTCLDVSIGKIVAEARAAIGEDAP